MIAIRFDKKRAPKELVSLWKVEKKDAAIAFQHGIPKGGFEFKAYACSEAKDALVTLFFGKCGYCESHVVATSSGDIEHYRPKAVVKLGKKKIPGYYWLAGETSNLLLSCSNCNTRKGQEFEGVAGKVKVGKGNEFPLWDESRRAMKAGEEKRETPLLLNPYFDQPEKFLSFAAHGGVTERPTSGQKHKKAQESIRIYGLDRIWLKRLRADHARRVLGDIRHVLKDYRELKQGQKGALSDLKRDWEDLCSRLEKHQPYLAMTHQLIFEGISAAERADIARRTKLRLPALPRAAIAKRRRKNP